MQGITEGITACENLIRACQRGLRCGLPIKYALIPTTSLLVCLLIPLEPNDSHFRIGIAIFALATWQMFSVVVMVGAAILAAEASSRFKSSPCPQTVAQATDLEAERKRIARELHDSHNQHMVALMIYIDLLEQSLSAEKPEVRVQFERIRGIADASLQDLHRLIYDLRPPLISDQGLAEAVRMYVRQTIETWGIQTNIEAYGMENKRYSPQLEIEIFRIVQEALANIVKHAHARSVRIHLQDCGHTITGFVEDDGKGFDDGLASAQTMESQSFGLLGMKERALSLNGKVCVLSQPGQGTRIEFSIPVT